MEMEFVLLMPIFIFTMATFFRVANLQKKHDEMMREIEALKGIVEQATHD